MTDFADSPGAELARKARQLQVTAIVEACTYIILLGFWFGGSTVGTAVTGSLHGMVVLAFAGMVVLISRDMGWSWQWVVLVLVTGPIGAILVYERIKRQGVPQPVTA